MTHSSTRRHLPPVLFTSLDRADVGLGHHNIVEPDAVDAIWASDLVLPLSTFVNIMLKPEVIDFQIHARAQSQALERLAARFDEIEAHSGPRSAPHALSPDFSWAHRNPKRKRGLANELASLTLRVTVETDCFWVIIHKPIRSQHLRRIDEAS